MDNASAHAAVVDEHSRNIDFQLKKFFEILCFDELLQGVLNSYKITMFTVVVIS